MFSSGVLSSQLDWVQGDCIKSQSRMPGIAASANLASKAMQDSQRRKMEMSQASQRSASAVDKLLGRVESRDVPS